MPNVARLIWKGLEAINELIGLGNGPAAAAPKRSRYGVFQRSRGVLDGTWIPVLSSWVRDARWEETSPQTRRGTLWIRTKHSGKEYAWAPNITRELARSFFRVRSAGRWIWRHFPPRHLRLTAARESAYGRGRKSRS